METHVREHRSLLASGERRLLIWMAARVPPSVNSDHLTLLGLLAMLAAGAAFSVIQTSWFGAYAVILALGLNWLGDSLDGTLARVRRQLRPRYGYYVDHVIDLVGAGTLVAGMVASGSMTPLVGASVTTAYFLVSAETFLATHSVGVMRLSFAAIGPTELRILIGAGAFAVSRHPWAEIGGRHFLLLDVCGTAATLGLLVVFVVSALRNARTLYAAEPLPRRTLERVA